MDAISPHSFWCSGAFMQGALAYAPLEQDARADVAIIGAGITGVTAAAYLEKFGRRVVVLDADRVGTGTTGGPSGHCPYHGGRFTPAGERIYGSPSGDLSAALS